MSPPLLEISSDLRSKGKVEIRIRSSLRSQFRGKGVRFRDVRLGNLRKRRGRIGIVCSAIVREKHRGLAMERNCL
ncbi:hypothetical protein A2U01_0020514 [Trifolium medium]|uniref:Uncharacterized protein n=1 Tax=Trifolium medium TaxID=97028 RepID=A0A392NI46_9FABA|nr:hypothetical protein [Trifolium medium]